MAGRITNNTLFRDFTVFVLVRLVFDNPLTDGGVAVRIELDNHICTTELTEILRLAKLQKGLPVRNFVPAVRIRGEGTEPNSIRVPVNSLSGRVSRVQNSLTIKDQKVIVNPMEEQTLLYP